MNSIFLNIPVLFGISIEVYFILLIIALPTFFFWKWVLKKYIKINKKRKAILWFSTIASSLLIYTMLITAFIFWLSYTPSINFDKSKWLTDKEGRFQMASDIINSKLLIGKDTNQVKLILGQPSWSSDTTRVWTYDMGFGGGGLGFLFHHLELKLDASNKVISVEHIEIRD